MTVGIHRKKRKIIRSASQFVRSRGRRMFQMARGCSRIRAKLGKKTMCQSGHATRTDIRTVSKLHLLLREGMSCLLRAALLSFFSSQFTSQSLMLRALCFTRRWSAVALHLAFFFYRLSRSLVSPESIYILPTTKQSYLQIT